MGFVRVGTRIKVKQSIRLLATSLAERHGVILENPPCLRPSMWIKVKLDNYPWDIYFIKDELIPIDTGKQQKKFKAFKVWK